MSSKAIDIYYYSPSPPARAVLMLMKALGLEHNIKITNVVIGESKKPEFIKMNPLHTIPLITDNGWHLYDSHVIMQYLVDKYAKDDSLYPKDLKKRAIVNLRFFFDACYLFPKFATYHAPTFYRGIAPSEEHAKAMDEVLMHLDHYLEENKYTAGSHLTIADFAIISTISTIDACDSADLTKYPHIRLWYRRTKSEMSAFGYEEVNQEGSDVFAQMYKAKLAAIQ